MKTKTEIEEIKKEPQINTGAPFRITLGEGLFLLLGFFIFTLYFSTGFYFFGSISVVYCFIVLFNGYIRYLRYSQLKGISKHNKTWEKQEFFKSLIQDKNFLNHHNYFQALESQSIYKKKKLRKSLIDCIKISIFISVIITLLFLAEITKSEGYIALIIDTFFILFFIFLICTTLKTFWNYFWKTRKQKVKIYQEKIKGNNAFLSYKKKIFFY